MLRRNDRRRERGVTLIMLTLLVASLLVPMTGLAIDGAILYLVKAKLTNAVDAAALAGARSLSSGVDLNSQRAGAEATMRDYFAANFPQGTWDTTHVVLTTGVAEDGLKTRTATVEASVQAPLYFMRILGSDFSTVGSKGLASRRDVNVMLVLDRSSSMSAGGVCNTMVAAARDFVDKFSNGRDRLGLITYMGNSSLDYEPTVNFKSQTPSLDTVLSTCRCDGNTGTAQALYQAWQKLREINEPGSLNLIVFFTDGIPNGLTARFPVKTVADTRYGISNTSQQTTVAKSTCTNTAPKEGVIAQWGGGAATGPTHGIWKPLAAGINSTSQSLIDNLAGCAVKVNGTAYMRQDLAYIPTQDLYGNSTTGYKGVGTYTSGAYAGEMRLDTPAAITRASTNAADDVARRIRDDSTYSPMIYAIGLGGTSSEPADHVFMNRVANTAQSTAPANERPRGMYVYSPSPAQLADAFNRIASEILRLAQ